MIKTTYLCVALMFVSVSTKAQWLSSNPLPTENNWTAASGIISWYNMSLNTPIATSYGSGIQMRLAEDSRFGSQIMIPTFSDQMFFRRYNDGSWNPWITVWSSNNLNKTDVDFTCKNLRANGNLWAKEIKVAVTNPWPDFVFGKKYKLIKLSTLEKRVKDQGHLPGMPSAAQVEKEGINLAHMNAMLLEKVEELTLHMINLDKQHRRLKAELKVTQEEVKVLKKRNDTDNQ